MDEEIKTTRIWVWSGVWSHWDCSSCWTLPREQSVASLTGIPDRFSLRVYPPAIELADLEGVHLHSEGVFPVWGALRGNRLDHALAQQGRRPRRTGVGWVSNADPLKLDEVLTEETITADWDWGRNSLLVAIRHPLLVGPDVTGFILR